MILKDTLKGVLELQKAELEKQDIGIPRELARNIEFDPKNVLIISGIRRCGKSTLLKQLIKKYKNVNYCNFEDQLLVDFEIRDFEKLNGVFQEINKQTDCFFFDEIQNIPGWERFVRKMQDYGKKFVITGSNSSLLSKELGTKLTGRHITKELFPFSFQEMLVLKKEKPSLQSFNEYFILGGFPEYLIYGKTERLQHVFEDIILRDIVVRHRLKNAKLAKEVALYLLSNISKEISYNKLKLIFNLGSINTISSYVSYFEESYLLFTIPRFSYSYKKQIVNPKKVYCIDVGLARANSISFSEDKGRMFENLVFIHLRQKYKDIYYYREKNECDFLAREKGKIVEVIQACYELNEDNKAREINGIKEAIAQFNLKKGKIITLNQKDNFGDVEVIPVWEWLNEKHV